MIKINGVQTKEFKANEDNYYLVIDPVRKYIEIQITRTYKLYGGYYFTSANAKELKKILEANGHY